MRKIKMVKVYDEQRKNVIAEVSSRCSSPGAAKAAGSLTAQRGTVNGEWVWIAKSYHGYKP